MVPRCKRVRAEKMRAGRCRQRGRPRGAIRLVAYDGLGLQSGEQKYF